jgi:hypothetical protein
MEGRDAGPTLEVSKVPETAMSAVSNDTPSKIKHGGPAGVAPDARAFNGDGGLGPNLDPR